MKKTILITVGLFLAMASQAQTAKPDSVPAQPAFVLKINEATNWLSKQGFQLRRSFDGSRNESKSAAISWNSDYENNKFFTVIDAAIKLSEHELLPNSSFIWTAFPKVEWHRNTIGDDAKKKNNLSGGIGTELFYNAGQNWYKRPFVVGTFDYKKDFVRAIKTTQTIGFLSFSGNNNGEPGAQVRGKNGAYIFRYYPYTGFEHYRTVGESRQKATMWANRLWFELYPLSNKDYEYLQFTFDLTYRNVLSDNLFNNGHMSWLILGLNFFPGGKDNIGIGLDYSTGEDPTSNFVKTQLLALGIKLKI